jgi:hypothetical protein
MNLDLMAQRFTAQAEAIRHLVSGLPEDTVRWKPAPNRWSVLEVLGHLLDEEREDFRRRVDLTLHQPGAPWPPIDPEGWVAERRYNEQDPARVLGDFLEERRRSVAWLGTLRDPDWTLAFQHPKAGPLRAGDVMVSWLAHDTLHLRQMAGVLTEHTSAGAAPFSTRYAGA